MKFKSQIKIGGLISYIALGINIVLTLVYTPWMIRQIGQANYGLYTLAISIIGMLMMDFGLSSAVSRFASKYRAEGNQRAIDNLVGAVLKLFLVMDVIIFVVLFILFFFLGNIYGSLTNAELQTFKVLYVMVAFFNLIAFPFTTLSGILTVYERFIPLKACDLFNKLATVVLVVLALSFNFNVYGVVAANILSSLATITIKLIVIKRQTPVKFIFAKNSKTVYKGIFNFTLWTTVISIAQRLTYNFTPSVIGMTSGSKEIALYSPASSIGSYFYGVAAAINGLFLPRISKFIAEKQTDKINELMIKVGRYQVLLLGLIFSGFICVGRDFMVLWLGEEYIKSYYCTVLIMLPALIEYSQQIANTTLIAMNLIKYQAIYSTVTSMVGVGISFVLSNLYGAIGSCIAIVIAAFANLVCINIVYRKKANLDVLKFFKVCFLPAILPLVFSIALSLFILYFLTECSWVWFVVKGIIAVIVYFVMFFLFYFSKKEKISVFKKIIRR